MSRSYLHAAAVSILLLIVVAIVVVVVIVSCLLILLLHDRPLYHACTHPIKDYTHKYQKRGN